MMNVMHLSPEQTDACENITFPQICLWAAMESNASYLFRELGVARQSDKVKLFGKQLLNTSDHYPIYQPEDVVSELNN